MNALAGYLSSGQIRPSQGDSRLQGQNISEISQFLRRNQAESYNGRASRLAGQFASGVTALPYRAIGAPVDMIAMGLRPFGYAAPDSAVVGGSEWMLDKAKRAGLHPGVSQTGAGMAGDILGQFAAPGVGPGEAKAAATVMAFGTRAKKFSDIRPPSESLRDVADSNFTMGIPVGNRTAKIDSLVGNLSPSVDDAERARKLAAKIEGDGGYIERLIVDQFGNVVEGQHRLRALQILGVKDVPVSQVTDYGAVFDALRSSGLRPEHARNIIENSHGMLKESGYDAARAISSYELPRGYEAQYQSALNMMAENAAGKSK